MRLPGLARATGGSGRTATRNLAALGVGELLARLIAFGVSVYVARTVGTEGYGIIGFGLALSLYFVTVAEWGMDLAGAREIAQDPTRVATTAGQVFVARLGLGGLLAALVAGPALLLLPQPDGAVAAAFALTIVTASASTRWVHLGLERSKLVALTRAATELVKVAVVLALVRGPADLIWVPLAQAGAEAVAAFVLAVPLRRLGFRPRLPDRALVLPIFRRATPLMITPLLGMVTYNSDLIFLRVFRGRAEAGLYLAAYMLISYLGVIGLMARASLVPTLTRLGERDAQRELHDTFMTAFLALGLPLAVGGTLLATDLIRFGFGEPYILAGPVLALLIWSIPLQLARSVLQALLIARGRQDRVLRMTATTALAVVIANVALIPPFGLMAAAATTVGGELLRVTLAWRYARAEGFGFAPPGRLVLPAIATAAMALALIALRPDSVLLAVALGAAIYAVPFSVLLARRAARSHASP